MNPFFFIVSFLLFKTVGPPCSCEAVIDYEYTDFIEIYDKPTGTVIEKISHDLKSEDYLHLEIKDKTEDFFLVRIYKPISKEEKSGWIKKENYIGTYARNYTQEEVLTLLNKPQLDLLNDPDRNSDAKSVISEYIPKLYTISDCHSDWVYVSVENNNTVYEGWLEPEMQCPNSYTTCN